MDSYFCMIPCVCSCAYERILADSLIQKTVNTKLILKTVAVEDELVRRI